jgi:predicted nucleic acid-binding protein
MHILDSDTATLLYYGKNANLNAKVRTFPTDHILAISIVTWCEIIRGRCDRLRKAADVEEIAIASHELDRSRVWIAQFKIIQVDDKALALFDTLKKSKLTKSIKQMDLLQACISIANAATLVTRNAKDFRPLSQLKIENWAA